MNTKKPNSKPNHLSSRGYLRIPQVLHLVPVSKSTWWTWVKDGKAPKPIKLGPKITAWKAEDINQFLDGFSSDTTEVA